MASAYYQNTYFFKLDVLSKFFILCGGRLYMNWILPTNPASKNPLIRKVFGWNKEAYCGFNYKTRLKFSYIYGIIHLIGAIALFLLGKFFSLENILVNLYPIIVQIYIGTRCWNIKKLRS